MTNEPVDVLVVGAGNAALSAALSAADKGARVAVLECAPREERGGNSAFTAGAMRTVYEGLDDLLGLMPDLPKSQVASTDFGTYTAAAFYDDMARVTEHRADPDLVEQLVTHSLDGLRWLRSKGVHFQPAYGRQAFKIDGRFTFWGGLTVETTGGGPGLIDALCDACDRQGVTILYEHRAIGLERGNDGIEGVRIRHRGREDVIPARAVVLASGGFEANGAWRTMYLGPGWDLAKVRGTRFNMGDGIRIALEVGASPAGNWSGAHAVAWDYNAPEFGDLRVGDGFQKHSYPLGVIVNARGERFVDEGADFRNYTYAKYGREILRQPDQMAWQVFDAKVAPLLRDEYRIREVSVVRGDTLEDLASRMQGIDARGFLKTMADFNNAVDRGVDFDPNVRDGRGTIGLSPPKSNWANPIEAPPFEAYLVTCGITFTFGGLRIDPVTAQVVETNGMPIPGLFACGELVGGLFYFNYPGGTGLTSGCVFGRMAGEHAAAARR